MNRIKKITYVLRKVEDVKEGKAEQRCKICDFGHNGTCHHPGGCKEGYTWKREPKPVVDEQKKRFAEHIVDWSELHPDTDEVQEAVKYLEGLEGE